MAEFLVKSCGFLDSEIRLLVDDRATTDAIRERLAWLVNGLRPGDRVLFHYSGHGTIIPLRAPNGAITEEHDAIYPIDFDFTPEHALTDAYFREIFAGVPSGVEFNWVSGSCPLRRYGKRVGRPVVCSGSRGRLPSRGPHGSGRAELLSRRMAQ